MRKALCNVQLWDSRLPGGVHGPGLVSGAGAAQEAGEEEAHGIASQVYIGGKRKKVTVWRITAGKEASHCLRILG